jgi:flagellar motility protein MotE (MotC chaperone)
MSAIKKTYHTVALLALLNLLALGGGVGYLLATGQLNRQRIEAMGDVLRSKDAAAEGEAPAEATKEEEPALVERVGNAQLEDEIFRRMADRRRAELDQMNATVRAARLEVVREREALSRREEEFKSQLRNRRKQLETEGFQKDLDLFSSMKASDAIYYLLQKPKEDAAKLLLAMETRKAKKIVEAAKSPAERQAMSEILAMLREMAPEDHELNKPGNGV